MKRLSIFQIKGQPELLANENPIGMCKASNIDVALKETDKAEEKRLRAKQAMAIAMSPTKNMFMTIFMLWMIGNTLNLWSIMVTAMSLTTPIKALFGVNKIFSRLDENKSSSWAQLLQSDLLIPKLIYIGLTLLLLAMGLYKCASLNLLPITSADWIYLLPQTRQHFEHVAMPIN